MTKTNAEADHLASQRNLIALKCGEETAWIVDQAIAALRRVPERIDAKMADLLVDTTWRKAVGQCINGICGLDGTTLGKSCGRLFISRERFDEHIAPLIRQQERPPSSELGKTITYAISLLEVEGNYDKCLQYLHAVEDKLVAAEAE